MKTNVREYSLDVLRNAKEQLGPEPEEIRVVEMIRALVGVAAGLCNQCTDGTELQFLAVAKAAYRGAAEAEASNKPN